MLLRQIKLALYKEIFVFYNAHVFQFFNNIRAFNYTLVQTMELYKK